LVFFIRVLFPAFLSKFHIQIIGVFKLITFVGQKA
jgi:hypothetical protein